ncbi:uncharacterized protein LAESUDRAFT_738137 [Laetiporus sulphureus 93-53]|uniref:RRM domain-containing protein n=1 Tax=Laetiporus sulphureus 93-53 TaxID=1314785 RepID=A0A165CZY3_9APHY|nr:uncharacterized protein LAESUDRAFT_738137 [Laetiporus sulphureus 93-53]KZT03855.1 hypothetical protein LAESUDRAFT_738137 [Laetiporus sulphureus 93-53]
MELLRLATRRSRRKRSQLAMTRTRTKIQSSPVATESEEVKESLVGSDKEDQKGDEEHLYSFSADDEDSSDDERAEEWENIDVSELPIISKDDAVVKQKPEKAKKHPSEGCGMRAYFSQFGTVTRLGVSRNKKVHWAPKHHAFIEFDSASVAKIVAEMMDNCLLMGHLLKCKVIPKDKVHLKLWVGVDRKWRAVPRARVVRTQHNEKRTGKEQEQAEERLLQRQSLKKYKLEEAGIDYNFETVAYKSKGKLSMT